MRQKSNYLLALLLGLVISVAAPLAANATTFSGKNGKLLVVQHSNDTHKAVFVWPSTGSSNLFARNVTSVDWSPNGRLLAMIKNDQLRLQWYQSSVGLTITQSGDVSEPQWSRDGRRLVFVRKEQVNGQVRSAIFAKDLRGNSKNISGWSNGNFGYRSPSWSPDGKSIAFERYGTDKALLTKDNQTGELRKVTDISDDVTSANVAWSPNGKKILYSDSENEVYTIWPDGSHRSVIGDGDSYQAAWSPDGMQIAFWEDAADDHLSVSREDGEVEWLPIDKGSYETLGDVVWSPDGKYLAFAMSKGDENGHRSSVFMYDLENAVAKRVTTLKGEIVQIDWQSR